VVERKFRRRKIRNMEREKMLSLEEEKETVSNTEPIRLTVSRVEDKVVIQFEEEVKWIAWTPVLATKVAAAIKEKAIAILESDVE